MHSSNYRKVNGASQLKFILKVSGEREREREGGGERERQRQPDKERQREK